MLKFTGTLSRLACCTFALTLSSCVPTASSPFMSKNWVYSALVPTKPEITRACDMGYKAGVNRDKQKIPGIVERNLQNGRIRFYSAVSHAYIECLLSGSGIKPSQPKEPPERPGNIWILESSSGLDKTQVSLELRDSVGTKINTIQNLSGEVTKGSTPFLSFRLPTWTNLEVIELNQSSSFAILIVQGQNEQRIEFRREDFGGLL